MAKPKDTHADHGHDEHHDHDAHGHDHASHEGHDHGHTTETVGADSHGGHGAGLGADQEL